MEATQTEVMPVNGDSNPSQETMEENVDSKAPAEETPVPEKEEWMDILGSGQLKKKILKPGNADTRPLRGYICRIKLECKLLPSNKVVAKEEDLTVQLGDAEVIQGLELALPLMNVGEEALVEVNPRFGYGKLGLAPDVPSSATLLYSVELLSAEPEPEIEDLSVKERSRIGHQKRERGNWWYSREEHSLAIQCYRKSLEYLDESHGGITSGTSALEGGMNDELKTLLEDRLKVYNNLAAAQMKLKSYESALQSVDNVLRCQPNNVKALFRKGKILAEKGENEQALGVLRSALTLEPDNKVIHAELSRTLSKSKQDRKEEKSLYRRMLGQDKPDSQTGESSSSVPEKSIWDQMLASSELRKRK